MPCGLTRAEEHGQVSKELAEPYYLYGRALLELAREKSAMFGKAIPGETHWWATESRLHSCINSRE